MLSLTRGREFWIYRQLARGLNAWPTAALVSWTRTQARPHGHGNHVERRWASKASRGCHSSLCLLNTQDPQHLFPPFSFRVLTWDIHVVWTTTRELLWQTGNHTTKHVDDLAWTCAVALRRIYHQQSDKWPHWYFMVCPWLAFVSLIGLAGPAVDFSVLVAQEGVPPLCTLNHLDSTYFCLLPSGLYTTWLSCCQVRESGHQDTCFLLHSG